MRTFKYEIVRRAPEQHRPGQWCLLIDGEDCEVAVDPAQFMEKALRQVVESSNPAVEAAQICDRYAARALERKIECIRRGRVPVGSSLTASKGAISGGTESEVAGRTRITEEEAVHRYLTRGRLKDMDKAARAERRKKLAERKDCTAEWVANRLALIARREQELASWKAEHAAGNHKAAKMIFNLEKEIKALKGSGIFNATHGIQEAYVQYLTAQINLSSADIRIWPLMTDTTADTERDGISTFSEYATVDEFDGANYSSGGLALDNQAVAVDDAADRAEFTADDEVVSSLGAGTRSIQGVALGLFSSNTAGSRPLHWLEFSSNKTPDGSNFTFDFSADGILQAVDG